MGVFEDHTVEATRGAFNPGTLTSGSSSKSAAIMMWFGRTACKVLKSCSAPVGKKAACPIFSTDTKTA